MNTYQTASQLFAIFCAETKALLNENISLLHGNDCSMNDTSPVQERKLGRIMTALQNNIPIDYLAVAPMAISKNH